MKVRLTVSLVFAALALVAAGPAVSAEASGDCSVPISLGEKPKMNDYADYSDFLVAIMGYKKKERDQAEHRKSCPELYTNPPVVWDGPENLDEAVQQADNRAPFDYQGNPTWYDRTTSQSIALQDVPAGVLSGELIQTPLGTLDFGALSDEQQGDMLLLAILNAATEDGSAGANVSLDFAEWLLPSQESAASIVAMLLSNPDIGEILVDEDGGLVLALTLDGGIFGAGSYSEFESCLSSCGEFSITLSTQ